MSTEPLGLQAGLRPCMCKRRIPSSNVPYFNGSGISIVSSTLSIFPLRLCEKPSRAKTQRLRSIAETTIKAQLINWFQAIEIKIRSIAFVLPPISPKKSRNMSRFFLVGIFFLWLSLPSITAVVFIQIRWSFTHVDCYGSPARSAGLRSAPFCP
jgi:hypothetical protein